MKRLFRPVGLLELNLMLDMRLRGFPPRLPEQPIFYPVLNKEYADEIAAKWNTKDKFSGYAGFVTEFDVARPFVDRYEEQIVGAGRHAELWVPSEELEEFNGHIQGSIRVVDAFFGADYAGPAALPDIFKDQAPHEQFRIWSKLDEDRPGSSRRS